MINLQNKVGDCNIIIKQECQYINQSTYYNPIFFLNFFRQMPSMVQDCMWKNIDFSRATWAENQVRKIESISSPNIIKSYSQLAYFCKLIKKSNDLFNNFYIFIILKQKYFTLQGTKNTQERIS